MWYIADAQPGAKLYVGLKNGISREDFEKAIHNGTVDQVVHAIEPRAGDSIFIPSGRLHAIGAGFIIYEIQQNSDTTYRVFDWNRMGLDGSPRELHIQESMRCINFNDIEPSMDTPSGPDGNTLASCPYFHVERLKLTDGMNLNNPTPERFSIVTVVKGEILSTDGSRHTAGDFLLQPRNAPPLTAQGDSLVLQTTIPE
jgi:mannose-6-phosphate isomerase